MSATKSKPRHRAPRSIGMRVTVSIGGILTCAGLVAAGTVAGLSTSGGTYATWNGSQSVSDTTITAGSLGITVNDTDVYQLDSTAWAQLLPGDVVSQQVLVKNTGTVPAIITASAVDSSGALEVRTSKGACSAPIVGDSATITPSSLGIWAAAEESAVCVQVTLSSTAAPSMEGQSFQFDLTLNATQEP